MMGGFSGIYGRTPLLSGMKNIEYCRERGTTVEDRN
jgi:hypothetical protein